jgi:hypothetical protein
MRGVIVTGVAQNSSPLMGEGREGVVYEARRAGGEYTPPLPLPIKGRDSAAVSLL